MNKSNGHILQLQKELAYYKKQVDMLSGSMLSNQYAFTQLSNVCKKYMNGFLIIADIQRSFSFYSSKEALYNQFLDSIFSQMFLDRVVLLEINNVNKALKPVLWKGFNNSEASLLANTFLTLPDEFLDKKKSILVISEVIPTAFEKLIKESLLTSHFILTPLIKNQQVWGALFVGMQGINPISYIPLAKSNIDMFESLAGMISAMTQQLEQREEMEKERNRIARDMHDDIGSELSKISITCEHLKNKFQHETDIVKELNVIKESTGSIVNNIGNIIWALNPINNTLDGLLGYMREYAFEYLEMHGIEVVFPLPEISENLVISHEARAHVFMVVKEALHNVVKHAAATIAEIRIYISPNILSCSVIDNGKGFLLNKNNRFGNGLRNMEQRITEAGGKFIFHSEYGKGTKVEFIVPL